jgi:Ca2+:H+ antiporter
MLPPLPKEIRHHAPLWLPVFVLSVLAIVPLAALLSHATESVAAETGDAALGLLNATLGNFAMTLYLLPPLAA